MPARLSKAFHPLLALLLASAPATLLHAQDSQRFGEWLSYSVPAEDGAPAIFVAESAEPIRGITVLYTCTAEGTGARESLLLLNPGFTRMPLDAEFDALFTFGQDKQRRYIDTRLAADPEHGTLDVKQDLPRILRAMRAFGAFIVTQDEAPITEIAIPLEGFDEAYEAARSACQG